APIDNNVIERLWVPTHRRSYPCTGIMQSPEDIHVARPHRPCMFRSAILGWLLDIIKGAFLRNSVSLEVPPCTQINWVFDRGVDWKIVFSHRAVRHTSTTFAVTVTRFIPSDVTLLVWHASRYGSHVAISSLIRSTRT